jgi:hypothetical protein
LLSESIQKKVRITSKNNQDLIAPSELLLPLNGLVNLINLMQNIENLYEQYEIKQKQKNIEPNFQKFIDSKIRECKYHIKINSVGVGEFVMLEAMSKKSPYWVDLIFNVSPHIISVIEFLIEDNAEELENMLLQLLNKIPCFRSKSNPNKKLIVKQLVKYVRWILTFVKISTDNNKD